MLFTVTVPRPTVNPPGYVESSIVSNLTYTLAVPTYIFSSPYTGTDPNYTIVSMMNGGEVPAWASITARQTCYSYYGGSQYCYSTWVLAGRAPVALGGYSFRLRIINSFGYTGGAAARHAEACACGADERV